MGLFDSIAASINPITAGVQVLGNLAGGYMDMKGQEKANEVNQEIAKNNRDWMTGMSNTAYQRAMVDMKEAGLNPLLAYERGGASTPSAAIPTVQNEMQGMASSVRDIMPDVMDTAQKKSQMQVQKQQRDLMKVQEKVQEAETGSALERYRSLQLDNIQKQLHLDFLRQNPKAFNFRQWMDVINPFTSSVKDVAPIFIK